MSEAERQRGPGERVGGGEAEKGMRRWHLGLRGYSRTEREGDGVEGSGREGRGGEEGEGRGREKRGRGRELGGWVRKGWEGEARMLGEGRPGQGVEPWNNAKEPSRKFRAAA